MIARNRSLAVHHVTVHSIGDKLSISLDLEVDGELSFAAAHDVADGLEATRSATSLVRRSRSRPISSRCRCRARPAATPPRAQVAAVETALSELAAASQVLRNVHDVRVRDTADGGIVNFHCDVDPTSKVADVHALVDGVESGLRRRFPAIKRVIGHAEPRA